MARMDGRGTPPAGRGRRLAPLTATLSIAIVLAIGLAQAPPYGDARLLPQAVGPGHIAEPLPWMPAWRPPVLQEAYADHLLRCTAAISPFDPNPERSVQVEWIRFAVPNDTYGLDDEIDIGISFYRPDGVVKANLSHATSGPGASNYYGSFNHTYLEMSIPGRSAEFLNMTNSSILFYRYIVQPGDRSADLGYAHQDGLHAPALRSFGTPGTVACQLPMPGGAGSLRGESDVVVDAGPPSVQSVSSLNGTYGTGRIVNITVSLEKPAVISSEPRLMLNTEPPRNASYAGGNGTANLSFLYAVRPGDAAPHLDYVNTSALYLEGGSIVNLDNGIAADALPLPEPGDPGSLSTSNSIGILGGPIPILRANGSAVHGSGFDMLRGASDVAAFRMNGSAYALVAATGSTAPMDHGIQLIRIHPNGTLSAGGWATDMGGFSLYRPLDVAPFEDDGAMRALVSSQDDNSIQLVDIHPNGTLSANGSATSAALPALAGASGASAVPMPAGGDASARILVTARGGAGGLQLVGILPNGTLAGNGTAAHGGQFKLDGAAAVDALAASSAAAAGAGAGSPPRALVASYGADSLQLVSILANGTILHNGSATRGTGGFDAMLGPTGVTVFDMGGRTRAAVPSFGGNSLQIVDILPDGTLVDAGSAANGTGGFDALGGASDAAVFEMGGRTYALVASYTDDGIQLARINADGTLAAEGSARDERGGFDALDNAEGVAVLESGGRTYALVAAQVDDAVQLVRLSPASVAGVSSPQKNGSYPAGAMISVAVAFDERVVLQDPSNPPSLLLSLDGENRTAPYLSGSGTDALVFSYTVMPGDSAASGLDYAHAGALTSRGAVTDVLGNAVDLGLPEPRMPGSLAHARAIVPDTVAPRVDSVSSPNPSGAYGVGSKINITVSFNEVVTVTGDGTTPSIALKMDDAADGTAMYDAGGSAGRSLAFVYTVEEGDNTANLDYANATALSDGGTVTDEAGNPADPTLPEPGTDGLLGDVTMPIRIDTAGPSVASVTESEPKGAPYRERETVRIAVGFGEAVVLSERAAPSLRLALDGGATAAALYERQTADMQTLVFNYTVRAGDSANPLDYDGADAMSLGSGTMTDAIGNDADLDLSGIEEGLSLADAGIRIDTSGPVVESVSSPNADGTYAIGSRINITVSFDEAVYVTGSPRIELDTGADAGMAAYDSGSGSQTLVFEYRVLPDDAADDLDYTGTGALTLNGGAIMDAAGNNADRMLPEPGGAGSLGHSKDIKIDTTAQSADPPSVLKVFSTDSGGTYDTGSTINITVAFSSAVNVTGAPMLALSTEPARSAAYVEGSDGDSRLAFLYEVQPGDSADRLDYAGTGALTLNGGTIRDAAGRAAGLELPPTGSADSLHTSGIAIDGRSTGPSPGGNGGSGGGNATGNTATVLFRPDEVVGQTNLTDRGNEVRVTINVTALAGAGTAGATVQFPSTGAVVTTSFASVSFPPMVAAMSVPPGGLLVLHVVAAADAPPPDSTIQDLAYDGSAVVLREIVEVGDEGSTVTFSMPVRISLEGQAGGRAFYIDGASGQLRPIDDACGADDVVRVHRHLDGAGECRIDSGDDMVIYTYHLTRFGTVLSESGAPPPVYHTCSVSLEKRSLPIGDARLGGYSDPAEQVLINTGSAPFASVGIEASPWRTGTDGGPGSGGYPSLPAPASGTGEGRASSALVARIYATLPAAASEVSESGRADDYAAVGEEAAVAGGLGGGDVKPLWFRLNLTPYGNEAQGGAFSQSVTYNAQCVQP